LALQASIFAFGNAVTSRRDKTAGRRILRFYLSSLYFATA
jgi:hypothetical protein